MAFNSNFRLDTVDISDEGLWRQVPNHRFLWVSRNGEVYNARAKRLITPTARAIGKYPIVKLSFQDEEGRWSSKWRPLHILVAEVWVDNPKPDEYNVVNHINGDKNDARADNLEWCTIAMNNKHAIDNGLRGDTIPCRIRDYYTKEVIKFPSLGRAKEYMGISRDVGISCINYKRFGKLIKDRWEFRYEDDPRPWFYENRIRKVSSRFILTVTYPDGSTKEFYNGKDFRKEFKLVYDMRRNEQGISLGGSMLEYMYYARGVYPGYKFDLQDAYDNDLYVVSRKGKKSDRLKTILGIKDNHLLFFKSIRDAATYCNSVDKSRIINVLNNPKKKFYGIVWFDANEDFAVDILAEHGLCFLKDRSNQ